MLKLRIYMCHPGLYKETELRIFAARMTGSVSDLREIDQIRIRYSRKNRIRIRPSRIEPDLDPSSEKKTWIWTRPSKNTDPDPTYFLPN